MPTDTLSNARSLLFVPGHRPERFAKAVASGADGIVLDLEDAVGPDLKDIARANVRRWFAEGHSGVVRVNGTDSPWYESDIAALRESPGVVMLPKVTRPEQVERLLAELPGSQVMPLLETSAGILGARDICGAPGILRAVFGNADLARELGIDPADRAAHVSARSEIVLASAACGLPAPIDGVTVAVTDQRTLAADAEHAVSLGFTGKLCLHPRQVPTVNAAFSPSADQLRWAREVIVAAEQHNGSVTLLDGQVVGTPVIERARRILSKLPAVTPVH
ncbi:CoA ester lyase [Saccharomonospora sp. NPDC046836]|uniref:HpcH/HpaI aldolase/citrate lyase family protein n=1 Tax=Saccharomonospora sp. NPDC046836 TaxID=3156921 RepID=UPI0033DEC086